MKPPRALLAALGALALCTGSAPLSLAAEPKPNISIAMEEVVRLAEAGVDAATIEAYVDTFQSKFHPQAAEILYLHEHKVPDSVIRAMILHEPKHFPAQPAHVAQAPESAQAVAAVSNVATPPQVPAAAPATVVYQPSYGYPAPYVYARPDPWWPSAIIGFGLGFGFGYHGGYHHGGHYGGYHGGYHGHH